MNADRFDLDRLMPPKKAAAEPAKAPEPAKPMEKAKDEAQKEQSNQPRQQGQQGGQGGAIAIRSKWTVTPSERR